MNIIDEIRHTLSSKFAFLALITIFTLSVSSLSMVVYAAGTENIQEQAPLATEFRKLDVVDTDNRLSRDEALKDKDIATNFDKADVNNDGLLDLDEYANFKSSEQKKRVEAFVEDAAVTAKVKAELIKDAGMKGIDISVETHKGQVILSGFVSNGEQLLRAVHIASGVRGVQSVKNALIIKG
ncbi:Osmotically-inducible protein Y [Methylophilaceae bacterium]|nr:Osmotically-inducible protein Y [Methylophilaceae bacterium]